MLKRPDIIAETVHAAPEFSLIALVRAEDLAVGNNVGRGSREQSLRLPSRDARFRTRMPLECSDGFLGSLPPQSTKEGVWQSSMRTLML